MKKQRITKTLLRMIAMIMILTMTISCMDFKVSAITLNIPQETTIKTKLEIETTENIKGEISSKSKLNKIIEKEEDVHQKKIDSSLLRDDPLAGKITKKATESIPAPIKEGIKDTVSLPSKTIKNLETNNKTINENNGTKIIEKDYEPGVVIVGFKQSYTKSTIMKQFPELKIEETEDQDKLLYEAVKSISTYKKSKLQKIEGELGTDFVIELKDKTKKSVIDAIEILEKNDSVEYAVPNYVLEPAITPNDSAYSKLWGMNKIQAPQAWDTYTGSNTVTVGIVDTGIDSGHPDLTGNINTELAYNAVTKTTGNTMDYHGHGTHVAGTVGARGNNTYGVVGINWRTSMVPIKIAHNDVTGGAYGTAMVEAVRYAIEKEIPICNMSYSVSYFPPLLDVIKEYNGLFIMSAGNNGENIDDLSQYTALNEMGNVIIVASSDDSTGENEKLSSFSNYGVKNVHIAAPGEGIYSTIPGGGYDYKTGTSMAAPHVTGVAALIKGKYPDLTMTEIKETILSAVDYPIVIGGMVSTGRLNVYKAINRISDSSSLVVSPNDNETMAAAIRRSLNGKVAGNIKYIKVIGNANMNTTGDNESSANNVLPNLIYADIGSFSGLLGDRAFANCRNLTTAIFPPNDFSLRALSFWYCTNLKTIYRANIKSRIKGEADFTGMISASSTGTPYAARVQAFQGCSSLTTIKMPNTNKLKFSIYIFNNCSNLTTIYLDGYPKIVGEADLTELTNINDGILRETAIRKVKLPKNIAISDASFANCVNLTDIQFHPNQTVRPAIGQDAFSNVNSSCVAYTNQLVKQCEPRIVISRTETENIPIKINSLIIQPITNETMGTAIEYYLDSRNPNDIKHLVIKGSAIMGYGGSANILPSLETADLSEFTGYTEKGAFYGCSNLKQVIYSISNNEIPAWSYINCNSLQTIQVADKYPKIWGEIDLSNVRGTLAINTQAFANCINIETVKLPSTGTLGISQYAFSGCSKLSTVYKNAEVKTTGTADLSGVTNFWSGSDFKNTGIVEVNLPQNVAIPKETFMNCINLNKIKFDLSQTSVVDIGIQAFYNVNPVCKAYMNKVLVENSTFIIPRTATQNIPKIAY